MYNIFSPFFICAIEFVVFYQFFYNFQEPKNVTNSFRIIVIILFASLLTIINMLGVPLLNTIVITALSVALSFTLFKGSLKTIVLLSAIIVACMVITEVVTAQLLWMAFDINYSQLTPNTFSHFMAQLLGKTVLVLVVRIAIICVPFHRYTDYRLRSAAASIFPLVSMLCIAFLYNIATQIELTNRLATSMFAICIAMLGACIVVIHIFDRSLNNQSLEMQLKMAEETLKAGELFDKEKERALMDLRQITHDYRNHMINMQSLYEGGKVDEANCLYVEVLQVLEESAKTELVPLNNRVASAIIHRCEITCKSNNIQLSKNIECDDLSFLGPMDTGAILDNIIDNAVEACMKLPANHRTIEFNLCQRLGFVIIRVKNSSPFYEFTADKALLSTKVADGRPHGFGITNIRAAVQKYNGFVDVECNKGIFAITVRLSEP